MVSGKITEALIILKNHAAMLLAVPQAGLCLDAHVIPRRLCEHVVHVSNQCFTPGSAIVTQFLLGRMAAGGAKYQRTHGAC
jgi:hypothetical protein